MLRRLTILAIVIWLVAGIPRAMGQDWKYGPSPPLIATSTERGAVTVAVSADYSIPKPATVPYQPQIQIPQPSQSIPGMPDTASLIPSVLPPADTTPLFLVQTQPNAAPMSPVSAPQQLDTRPQEIDARLNWSLGEIGPVAPIVAADLNPPGQHLGWYGTFDIGIMKPHLRTQLTTAPDFNGPTGGPITIGASSLDWTGVPEFSLGYRFSQGAGELQATYRLVLSSGTEALPGNDLYGNPARLHSSLNVQTLDFDYITQEFLSEGQDISRFFFRELRAGVGLRAAAAYFDNRASGFPITDTHMSSAFGGVGPRMFVELRQDLGRPDIQFYTRLTGDGVLGPILQKFDQTTVTGGTTNSGAFDTHNKNIGMGIFQVEAGFSWEPQSFGRRFRFTAAYSWERWWSFGRTDDSNAELTLQGAVLRAEFRY